MKGYLIVIGSMVIGIALLLIVRNNFQKDNFILAKIIFDKSLFLRQSCKAHTNNNNPVQFNLN